MIRQLFTAHPKSVGESYLKHMRVASGFGVRMTVGGLACLVHAIFPFFFTRTGSATITALHETVVRNRSSAQNSKSAVSDSAGHPTAARAKPQT